MNVEGSNSLSLVFVFDIWLEISITAVLLPWCHLTSRCLSYTLHVKPGDGWSLRPRCIVFTRSEITFVDVLVDGLLVLCVQVH